jgi:cytochrome oxidase Cu insertion factor (SCO1/SenC/PrrC family)
MTSRAAAAALAAALLLAAPGAAHEGAGEAPPAREEAPRYEPPAPGSYELPPFGRVAERELLGPDGAPAPLLALGPGEAALVAFVYLHCPDACPLATAVFQRLDRTLAERPEIAARVTLVTVSFDPARDTPERMAALRRSLAPRARWRFLTASSLAAIDPVLADFGQDAVRVTGGSGAPEVATHVLKVFLVDGEGRIRNVYSSGFLDARVLLNDLLTVLAE